MKRIGLTVGCALTLMTMASGCHDDWAPETPVSPGDQPQFGATVRAVNPPPPISGGTLVVGRDGVTAVAADSDRDSIYLVDLTAKRLVATLALQAGDEPGRVTEGASQQFYVALRGGGAIVHVDASNRALRERIPVCSAPRGVAADVVNGVVHVACAGGELVTVRTSDNVLIRTLQLGPDLRDVVVSDGTLMATRFHSAEGFEVAADGTVQNAWQPIPISTADAGPPDDAALRDDASTLDPRQTLPTAEVAWRAVAAPGGGLLMAHQFAANTEVIDDPNLVTPSGGSNIESSPYGGGGCGAIVSTAVTWHVGVATRSTGGTLMGAVLPVDIAVAHSADRIVVVAAGNSRKRGLESLFTLHSTSFSGVNAFNCGSDNEISTQPNAQAIAAAFDGQDHLIVQSREPAALFLVDTRDVIPLSNITREDTGHGIFHANSGQGIACASCHPEGGDDGHVWNFSVEGRRRTQSLAGGLSGTEPFHWDGALSDMSHVITEVYQRRMGGPNVSAPQLDALTPWVNSIRRVPASPPSDQAAVDRGRLLFNDATVACSSCHIGSQGTNNMTVNVGTGLSLQVPRLVGLGLRAPFMHDGCASTLRDRFGACGGGDAHGHTSQLSSTQIDDLVAYLSTL